MAFRTLFAVLGLLLAGGLASALPAESGTGWCMNPAGIASADGPGRFGPVAGPAGATSGPGAHPGGASDPGATHRFPPVQAHPGAALRVAYLPFDSEIDDAHARFFSRAIDQAVADHDDAIIVHLSTDGGTLFGGRDMLQAVLRVPADGPRLIAYIDHRAYSAGAMVAYGHQAIYMTPTATIGDIGVIMVGGAGGMTYAPEKMETVVRTLLRSAAQKNGWPEAKLQKMTARNQSLYRLDLPTGPVFVIEDDLDRFLADHPEARSAPRITVLGHDRLLSVTAHEAVDQGLATGLVSGLADLEQRLGIPASAVTTVAPSRMEEMSWTLSGWAPLMASLAVFCLIMEFKMPSGLWLTASILVGTAFFTCQYFQQLSGLLEPILVVIGIGLVAVELLYAPVGGWLALLGGAIAITGLVLSFMPDAEQFHPEDAAWFGALLSALFQSSLTLMVLFIGLVAVAMSLPRWAAFQRAIGGAAITATSAGPDEQQVERLIGRLGVTRSPLSPSGSVLLEQERRERDAICAHGVYLAPDTPIEVTGMRYGQVIVRQRPAGHALAPGRPPPAGPATATAPPV